MISPAWPLITQVSIFYPQEIRARCDKIAASIDASASLRLNRSIGQRTQRNLACALLLAARAHIDYTHQAFKAGGVAEWFKAAVLKTAVLATVP